MCPPSRLSCSVQTCCPISSLIISLPGDLGVSVGGASARGGGKDVIAFLVSNIPKHVFLVLVLLLAPCSLVKDEKASREL